MTLAELLAKLEAKKDDGTPVIEGGQEMANAVKAELKVRNDEAAKHRTEKNEALKLTKKYSEALDIQDGDDLEEKLAEVKALKEQSSKPGAKNEDKAKYEALEKKFEAKLKALEAANETEKKARLDEYQKRITQTKVNKALAALQGTHRPEEMVTLVMSFIETKDDETFIFKNGEKESTIEDGVKDWLKLHPEYVKSDQNLGSGGSGSGGGSNTENPWSDDTYNFTKQMKIERENPTLAKQLEAAAKKKPKK